MAGVVVAPLLHEGGEDDGMSPVGDGDGGVNKDAGILVGVETGSW